MLEMARAGLDRHERIVNQAVSSLRPLIGRRWLTRRQRRDLAAAVQLLAWDGRGMPPQPPAALWESLGEFVIRRRRKDRQ